MLHEEHRCMTVRIKEKLSIWGTTPETKKKELLKNIAFHSHT